MNQSNSNKKRKKDIAKERWMFLIKALVKNKRVGDVDNKVSVRRFPSFGLLSMSGIDVDKEGDRCHRWYEYACKAVPTFKSDVRLLDGAFNVSDILGFNNTGNICVWPAEEVLTYYCLKNVSLFREKVVCELGGGMTCLAGLSIAVSSEAKKVLLTDGNERSVENVTVIAERNKERAGNTEVEGRVLLWNEYDNLEELAGVFDFVVCADCLFFDDCRDDLSLTIYKLLKPKGEAILFAPTRGKTFQEFVSIAKSHFEVEQKEVYDDLVWKLHEENLSKGSEVYDPDLHYPLMLRLMKTDNSS